MKILLVDDERDHVALIRDALADAAFKPQISIAHSLAEAKRALKQDPPDFVICDHRLPDGTGLELLPGDAVQRSLPIVVLTGKGDEALAVKALKAGAMDYVVKTNESFADLPHIVERNMAQWQQIKETEHSYRTLFQLNPLMCFNLDADGKITAVNEQGARQLGYTVDELTGQPVTVLFSEELHEGVHKQLQTCLAEPGRVFSWEIAKVRKDGSGLWVNETASAIPAGSAKKQPSVLIMCEDITERKQAHEKLESSEERYRTLFQSVADYAMLLELQPSGPPVIIDANDAAFSKHGYTRDEMIGQSIGMLDDSIPPSRGDEIRQRLEAGELVRFETRHRCKDGSMFDVEVSVRKVHGGEGYQVYTVERDITKRKAAEAILKEHVEELERFQQATIDREFRIKELREEIARLKARLGDGGDADG